MPTRAQWGGVAYPVVRFMSYMEPSAQVSERPPATLHSKTVFEARRHRAIVREKRRNLRQLEWSECIITEGNRRLKTLYRDALEVAQKCV